MACLEEYTSSDIKYELECTPCKVGGIMGEAKYYCPKCHEYYCDACMVSHQRLKATMTHKLLHGAELYKKLSQIQSILPIMICSCDQSSLVSFFCDDHKEVFCFECKGISHRNCVNYSIEDNSNFLTKNTLESTLERVKSFHSRVERLQEEEKVSVALLQEMECTCKAEINTTRNNLHALIDEASDKTIRELQETALSSSKELCENMSLNKSILLRLTNDQKSLNDAVSSRNSFHMCVTNVIVTKKCDEFEKLIDDLEKNQAKKTVSFRVETCLSDLQTRLKTLGEVHTQVISKNQCSKRLLSKTVDASSLSVIYPPGAERMTGSAFIPNGDLVVIESIGKTVKLFDVSFSEKTNIKLTTRPWDVTASNHSNLIVSLPWAMKLQFLEIPTLKRLQCIELDKKCFGIQAANNRLFVTCSNDPGEGEVRIMKLNGDVTSLFQTVLHDPCYLYLNNRCDRIFVSDFKDCEMHCLSLDGQVQFKFENAKSSFRGMIVDKDEHVFICDYAKGCVSLITENGTKHVLFLNVSKANPVSISYRNSDDTLAVICFKEIRVYRLK